MWKTEWSTFCHEKRTKECPFKHSGNRYKIMFNLWILELQDIMEIKNMHKSKKSFVKLQEVGESW